MILYSIFEYEGYTSELPAPTTNVVVWELGEDTIPSPFTIHLLKLKPTKVSAEIFIVSPILDTALVV